MRIRPNRSLKSCARWWRTGNFREFRGSVTISAGIAAFPTHGRTRDEIVRAADSGLYAAKQAGRNRICLPQQPQRPPQTATNCSPGCRSTTSSSRIFELDSQFSRSFLAAAFAVRSAGGSAVALDKFRCALLVARLARFSERKLHLVAATGESQSRTLDS